MSNSHINKLKGTVHEKIKNKYLFLTAFCLLSNVMGLNGAQLVSLTQVVGKKIVPTWNCTQQGLV